MVNIKDMMQAVCEVGSAAVGLSIEIGPGPGLDFTGAAGKEVEVGGCCRHTIVVGGMSLS